MKQPLPIRDLSIFLSSQHHHKNQLCDINIFGDGRAGTIYFLQPVSSIIRKKLQDPISLLYNWQKVLHKKISRIETAIQSGKLRKELNMRQKKLPELKLTHENHDFLKLFSKISELAPCVKNQLCDINIFGSKK